MKKTKFKIRKPSKFKIKSSSYFAEQQSEQEPVSMSFHDPRLSPGRLDGGRIRAVFFNDNLTPILA